MTETVGFRGGLDASRPALDLGEDRVELVNGRKPRVRNRGVEDEGDEGRRESDGIDEGSKRLLNHLWRSKDSSLVRGRRRVRWVAERWGRGLTRRPPPRRSMARLLCWRSSISPETEVKSVWKDERKDDSRSRTSDEALISRWSSR